MRVPYALGIGALFLLVLGTLSAPGGGTAHAAGDCRSADPTLDAEEIAFYLIFAQYRTSNGLPQVAISTNLTKTASWMAADMAEKRYFGHTDSAGRDPSSRAIQCGYVDQAGENIAAGTSYASALQVFEAWRTSAGHNANMMNPNYVQMGIARHYDPSSPYGYYWVTEFGMKYDGTDGSDIRIAESGVRYTDVKQGAWNVVTVLPGGVRVTDLPGWTVWDPLQNGWWQQWGPRDYIPGGTKIGLMPQGMSMDLGRNPR
jgi:uncharacterized protein YkwD